MKKRLIGGTGYVLLTYLTLFFNMYVLMIISFLIIGTYEFYKMYNINKQISTYFIIYFIIFLLGIFSLNMIDMLPNLGTVYMFILLTMIMIMDTFAYLIGKFLGKHKITNISPNKTYEGLIGGMVVALTMFIIYIIILDKPYSLTVFGNINIFISILIMFLTLLFCFFGDILESKIKREYKIKDSGKIVYGHGGILDRIDSLIVGSIIYISFVLLFI